MDTILHIEGHGQELEGQNEGSNESAALPPQPQDECFLVTVSELRDRKTRRRVRHKPASHIETIQLVELGLKAK
jgi:hypothetical protein